MAKTISVELYVEERDFIIELIKYALSDELLKKIRQAKPNKENIIKICLDRYDLEDLIGNLSLEANHNKKRSTQELACEMAEKLESYEFLLKKEPMHS
mgnify:CR=1 FL=1